MQYKELIQNLFQVNTFHGVKLGLQNAQCLQQLFDFPDRTFPSIHVAGTNGKGSVSTKIASGFACAGYRVGLFTSPHISTFRERIRINGVMISEEDVEILLLRIFETVQKANIPATFFELTTMLCLLYFANQQIDIAVIETGLGGRLDATNIITPCLSVITSISHDHTDLLGHSLDSIAQEKAGIIKEHIPVVVGPRVPLAPIASIIANQQSPCIQVNGNFLSYEAENQSIAQAALDYLSFSFSLPSEAIQEGLRTKPSCRFEILQRDPIIILDVAHNPDGFESLFRRIEHEYPDTSLRVVFGISKNKDVETCVKILAKHGSHFHLVESGNGRGVPTSELFAPFLASTVHPSFLFSHSSIAEAIQIAQREAIINEQIVVICGSFFIMSEARLALGFIEPMDEYSLNEHSCSLLSTIENKI